MLNVDGHQNRGLPEGSPPSAEGVPLLLDRVVDRFLLHSLSDDSRFDI